MFRPILIGEMYVSPKGWDPKLPKGYILDDHMGDGPQLYFYERPALLYPVHCMNLRDLFLYFWEEFRTSFLGLNEAHIKESPLYEKTQDLATLFSYRISFLDSYFGLVWCRDEGVGYSVLEVSRTQGVETLHQGDFSETLDRFLTECQGFIDFVRSRS